MRWLIPVGLVLMLAGGACDGAARPARALPPGAVPADEATRSNAGPLILGAARAGPRLGVVRGRRHGPLVAPGAVAANPWNEHRGGPPVGLV